MSASTYIYAGVIAIVGIVLILYYKNIIGVGQAVVTEAEDVTTTIGKSFAGLLGLNVTGTQNGIVQVSKTIDNSVGVSAGNTSISVGDVTSSNVPGGSLIKNGINYSYIQLANDPSILGSLQVQEFPTYSSENNSYGAFSFSNGMVSIPVQNEIQTPNGTATYNASNGSISLPTSQTVTGNIAGVEGWI